MDEKVGMQNFKKEKEESISLSEEARKLFSEFLQICQTNVLDKEKIIVLYDNITVFLQLRDRDEKTGLDYLCEQNTPPLDLILYFIETGGAISIVIAYIDKLIFQAIKESHFKMVISLLSHTIKDKNTRDIFDFYSRSEGDLIEQFIHFFLLLDEETQYTIINAVRKNVSQGFQADVVMENALELCAENLKSQVVFSKDNDNKNEERLQFDFEWNDEEEDIVKPSAPSPNTQIKLECSNNMGSPLKNNSLYRPANTLEMTKKTEKENQFSIL